MHSSPPKERPSSTACLHCSDWNQVIGTCSFRLGRIEEEVKERKSRETLDQITLRGRRYELSNKRGDFVFDFLVFFQTVVAVQGCSKLNGTYLGVHLRSTEQMSEMKSVDGCRRKEQVWWQQSTTFPCRCKNKLSREYVQESWTLSTCDLLNRSPATSDQQLSGSVLLLPIFLGS